MPQKTEKIKNGFPDISNTKLDASEDKILLFSNITQSSLKIRNNVRLLYPTLFIEPNESWYPEVLV